VAQEYGCCNPKGLWQPFLLCAVIAAVFMQLIEWFMQITRCAFPSV
jgi:hypothetical protein